MAELSKIEWTTHTFNPWIGCAKVSPGCAHCYAETLMDTRYKRVKWGKGNPRSRTSAATWKMPVKWNRDAGESRPRVFCASLSDWLDDEVPIEWLADLLRLIHATPQLDWLLLTKRPKNFGSRIEQAHAVSLGTPLADWMEAYLDGSKGGAPNVWIGATAEDQKRADERIPLLLNIPARVRFLSCEPLLEEVRLDSGAPYSDRSYGMPDGLSWVICGGESGQGRRPFQAEWACSLRDQCKAAGVPFFMKQMDKVTPIPDDLMVRQFPSP